MPAFRETDEFKRGRTGERVVAGQLMNRGWFVVPSYDYSGEDGNKAPKMEGANLSLVIPDLDIAKHGDRRWIEVKTKWKADLYRKKKRLEHGISRRHYEHYQQVEAHTGTPVSLFIYEESTGIILCHRLSELPPPRIYDGGKMGRDGMVFWPRDCFREFARVAPKVKAA